MKKIYRLLTKKFSFYLILGLSKLLSIFNFKIILSYSEIKNYNFRYSKYTRRLIHEPSEKIFSKLIVDTSHYNSLLCKSGANYGTNKSPLNIIGHRSGYTPYYDLLFRHLKNEKINFAEWNRK